MNIAAYCRVSTDKEDQLNSLEAQKKFFTEYVQRTGDTLVRLYADEGISGTKTKNRKEFLQMMDDAEHGLFDMLVSKDISRFARNTVDLLQNVRHLKSLGIETVFLTANMTSAGDSEFLLTLYGAIAQEESANTSKRIKFGKKINAKRGRVPNIVYGYDKIPGNYFDMRINEKEAQIIRQIFDWYAVEGYGTTKIAHMLNDQGCPTKRGQQWSQTAICNLLKNELYVGRIINGKQEISDFLTGARAERDRDEWFITERPDLRIVDPARFQQVQEIRASRKNAFQTEHTRQSNTHLFSSIIRCKECGWAFRQIVRTYKNTYVRWVCSGRNMNGADTCPNATVLDENELIDVLQEYFNNILASKEQVIRDVVEKFERIYKNRDENADYEKTLKSQIDRIQSVRQKYMDMYADDLISREELNKKLAGMKQEQERLENERKVVSYNLTMGQQLENILQKTFQRIEDVADVRQMTNAQLKQIVQKIEVDKDGNVEIFLKLFSDLGIGNTILIHNDCT